MSNVDPLNTSFDRWSARAESTIRARLSDAHSHALLGRIAFAAQRLTDLHHALAGPHGTGIIGDSRAAAYREAFRATPFDERIHDPARRHPTPEGEAAVRSAKIGGTDPHQSLGILIDRARRDLVIATAGYDSDVSAPLDAWHATHAAAIKAWARRTISDGQMRITASLSHWRLKSELRGG